VAAPHHHIQRAARGTFAVARATEGHQYHLRNRLLTIFWVTVAIACVFTVVVFFTERHAQGTDIHNLFDSFLFTMSQLLTASSVASPATNAGKVLELFFDLYALTVVAATAGSFGAFFHRRSQVLDEQKRRSDAAAAGTDTPEPSAAPS
jgi:hypothetical protein